MACPTCPHALRARVPYLLYVPYVPRALRALHALRAHVLKYILQTGKFEKWKFCTHTFLRVLSLILDLNFRNYRFDFLFLAELVEEKFQIEFFLTTN